MEGTVFVLAQSVWGNQSREFIEATLDNSISKTYQSPTSKDKPVKSEIFLSILGFLSTWAVLSQT